MKKIVWSLFAFCLPFMMFAQGTSGTLIGNVIQKNGQVLSNATVEAIHEPSGTKYKTNSNNVGKFNLTGIRIGGPYKITVKYVGFTEEVVNEVYVQLGDPTVVNFTLTDTKTDLQSVNVSTTRKGALISKDRKGTGTNINKQLLSTLPTLSRSITDFTKLTPQSNGTSFAGQDNRAINFTLDGSIYNNSFGLSNLNGGQTNSTPISLDAIEEIQVSISPYDLKSTGFVGGNINAVTKSGTNTFHGSVFSNNRNDGFVGKKAGDGKQDVTIVNFDVKQFGVSLGGPIIKNKLFFFANYENEKRIDPSAAFSVFTDTNKTSTGTRLTELNKLSTFLDSAFNYKTGNYKDYN
ncbi:MAG: carboxypeptidase-like regulatory domain-containing protein, partial [Sediminibacterium sp.]|nr:carboxypeptidase-like regulatory domain-containing protein [Sediminibacterium sp.]